MKASGDGEFEGWACLYDEVDSQDGCLFEKGAFENTVKAQPEVLVIWMHDYLSLPLGVVQLEDRAKGLWAKGRLSLDSERNIDAYEWLKDGSMTLGVGGSVVCQAGENGVRRIQEFRVLWVAIINSWRRR